MPTRTPLARLTGLVSAGLLGAGLLGAGVLARAPAVAEPVDATAVVLEVIDGDTMDIRDANRGHLRVRVLGIDTPETNKPNSPVECWGPEATRFATETMLGRRVAVVPDPTQDRTDRYGRTLAYLIREDGWNYSVEAARAGMARAYVYGGAPVSRYDEIAAAEQQARAARRGLWGPPCNGATEPVAGSSGSAPAPTVYYRNCAEARAAGAAPLLRGQPGYRSDLDGDGDGVACEPKRR
ncbi:Thermonuclease [Mycolicibacterium hassiacum DSM 44199]|uniref:thermonuclease family protein n=1 Tax=Mycolicibacterium hassiacum TaxID=46351 RepID=UPI000AF12B65|nr:thermonuclease family protein [Mycolicibacterium hassiacum]VCT92257.1 Thermonuclease [Mycolicibacterium hassiacum DSM 44199]